MRSLYHMQTDPVARFWAKVDKSGGPDACWIWQGSRTKAGYGHFRHDGKLVYTHRFVEELTRGPLSPKMHSCHRCDNPPCCNPAHLFRGTAKDNMHDRDAKGRGLRGKPGNRRGLPCTRGNAKLYPAEVLQIRALYQPGAITQAQIAARFGISEKTVCSVLARRTWANL
jgi:hypothetical protein